MRLRVCVVAFCVLAVSSSTSWAQTLIGSFPPEGGAISVSAVGGDVNAGGLDFISPSGGLIPDPSSDSSPFTFFLANSTNQVTFGNLGSSVRFASDSTTVLPVGALAGTTDIQAAWGDGPTPIPFSVSGGGGASVGLADDLHFVLSGTNETVSGLRLSSSGGSLIPGLDASPFASILQSTNSLIQTTGNVTIDGAIKLSHSWNAVEGIRDVQFAFDDNPLRSLSPVEYPPRAPTGGLSARIGANDQLIISGRGNELRELDFQSPSGSLVPATSAEPFAELLSNQNTLVHFNSPSSFVKLDGDLTLNAGYSRVVGGEDVTFGVRQVGDTSFETFGRIVDYPAPAPRVQLRLDRDGRFVVRGNGEELVGFDIVAPTFLIPGSDDPTPFGVSIANDSTNFSVGVMGPENAVTLDDDIRLPVSLAPNAALFAQYSYQLPGGSAVGPLSLFRDSVSGQDVTASLNRNLNWVLTGNGQQLSRFQLGSNGGGLVPASSAVPFESLGTNTNESIVFDSSVPITVDGQLTLNAGWDFGVGARDVWYDYLEDGSDLTAGPFRVALSSYPSPPIATPIRLAIDEDDFYFQISGTGQTLTGLRLRSPSGSILPGTSPAPFDSLAENTEQLVSLGGSSLVTLDGTLKLDARWNFGRQGRDVTADYDQFGFADVRGPVSPSTYPSPPAPVRVVVTPDDFKLELIGVGQEINGLRFDSESGSLAPADNATPFGSLVENTVNGIEFTADAPVSIDGALKLSAGWRPINSERDITYGYDQDGVRFGAFDVASYPNRPQPRLGLAEDLHFVMQGEGQIVDALSIRSGGGSLVPSHNPAPFQSLGGNTNNLVELSGGLVTLDGEIKLATAWNPIEATRDVTYQFGDGQVRAVNADEYPPRAPVGNISARINDNDQFVLSGNGNQLRGALFTSESRSLVPGESAAPFTEFTENTSRRIRFDTSSFVTLDGDLTLDAGYNRQVGGEDVRVSAREVGDRGFRFTSPITDYPAPTPRVNVSLDQDNKFVLTGQGEQLLGLDLTSESGSLVLGNNNRPFDITLSNTANQLTFGVLGAENAVTLDGSIALSAAWNPLGSADVEYSYGLIGGATIGPFELFREAPPELDVVRVSLNDNFNWVLNGSGQRLEQFDLFSERGGLIPAETPEPFETLPLNDEVAIRFETNGNVTVDGFLTLNAGWDPDLGVRDVRYWYREEGDEINAGPFVVPDAVYPEPPPSSRVRVSIDDVDRKFVLRGEGHLLRTFEFNSPSGSLLPAETPAPFESLAENTTQRVAYEIPSNVTLDGSLKLNSGYDIDVAGEDVSYRYRQLGFQSLRGPFDVDSSEYPPNPRRSPLRVRVNNDLNFVVTGIGQPVTGITFESEGGSLVAGDDPAPFDEFVSTASDRVELSSLGLVRIDGELVLPLAWNETAADVEFIYSLDGDEDERGPFPVQPSDYPGPNVINVAVSFNGGSIAFVGSGQLINGFEVRSPSGALLFDNADGLSPFDTAVEQTPTFAKFTSETPVPVNFVQLPFLRWDVDLGPELEFIFDSAGAREIVAVANVEFIGPLVPEPNGNLLAMVAVLGLLTTRRRHIA